MNRETEEANELFTKALHNAIAWQNRCVDLWEIIEMFCLDAEAEAEIKAVIEKIVSMIKIRKERVLEVIQTRTY